MENNYKISVYRHFEDDKMCWVAIASEFPAVPGIGNTREEALADLDEGIEDAIEHLKELGLPLPEPYVFEPDNLSGRFTVRVPRTLHGQLIAEAEEESVSLNQYLVYLLSRRHETLSIRSPESPAIHFHFPLQDFSGAQSITYSDDDVFLSKYTASVPLSKGTITTLPLQN